MVRPEEQQEEQQEEEHQRQNKKKTAPFRNTKKQRGNPPTFWTVLNGLSTVFCATRTCQRMAAVPQQIISVDQKITVGVQLPKFAVQDVKMFVGKIIMDHVDVVVLVHRVKSGQQIWFRTTKVSGSQTPTMKSIHAEKDSGGDGAHVFVLEFRGRF